MKLRILTLNVWNLVGDPSVKVEQRRQAAINQELRRLDPDLVSWQEVVSEPGQDQLEQLLEGTELFSSHQADHWSYHPPRAETLGGTAISTRWEHRVVEVVDLRGSDTLQDPWATMAAVVNIPGVGEMLFIATVLAPGDEAEAARERQACALVDLDDRHRRQLPTVIAGDFNAIPDASSIRYLAGNQSLFGRSTYYHDVWREAGTGDGYTWTSDNPNGSSLLDHYIQQLARRVRIDYIFIAPRGRHPGTYCRIERTSLAFDQPIEGVWASDHFGVLVDVEIGLDAPPETPKEAGQIPAG